MQDMSKMLDLDMSIPAISFALFDDLPKELRLRIWMHALPNQRIIHVERHLVDAEEDMKGDASQDYSKYPLATYFSSPSPNGSITSLLGVCKESRTVVKQHYSPIFPSSSTWISFSTDFIYLDWGSRYFRTPYCPEHFTSSWHKDYLSDQYLHPEFNVNITRQVKNLVVYEHTWKSIRFQSTKEQWVVQDLLRIFPAVEVLVFADQLHSRDEAGEELVWLSGELGEELEGECGRQHELEEKEENRLCLGKSILWGDWTEYGLCYPFNLENIREAWENHIGIGIDVVGNHTEGREMPKIVRKSITSATLKQRLLEIFGSEENMRKLESMDWAFVKGRHDYGGELDLSQQIAFLKLVLSRILLEKAVDCQGCEVRGPLIGGVPFLLARIDRLVEEMMRDLVVREAEEMT